jgi:hypothetical protein
MVRTAPRSRRKWWSMWICTWQDGRLARCIRSVSAYYISFSLEDASKTWISK